MGRQDFLDIRDSSKVVALDFGSAEFRRNAHRLVADWARQPSTLRSNWACASFATLYSWKIRAESI